jgi:hypothetical protein
VGSSPLGCCVASPTFGWPLLIAGLSKGTYDVLLLILFRHVPETIGACRAARGPGRTAGPGLQKFVSEALAGCSEVRAGHIDPQRNRTAPPCM